MQKIYVKPPYIKLEQFLKFAAVVSTGGEAKMIIQNGEVSVNGEVCLARGKKLFGGEKVTVENQIFEVVIGKN
jgi:ribosome-associated protein